MYPNPTPDMRLETRSPPPPSASMAMPPTRSIILLSLYLQGDVPIATSTP